MQRERVLLDRLLHVQGKSVVCAHSTSSALVHRAKVAFPLAKSCMLPSQTYKLLIVNKLPAATSCLNLIVLVSDAHPTQCIMDPEPHPE